MLIRLVSPTASTAVSLCQSPLAQLACHPASCLEGWTLSVYGPEECERLRKRGDVTARRVWRKLSSLQIEVDPCTSWQLFRLFSRTQLYAATGKTRSSDESSHR